LAVRAAREFAAGARLFAALGSTSFAPDRFTKVAGMRVTGDEETEGLDTVEHNEKGYNL